LALKIDHGNRETDLITLQESVTCCCCNIYICCPVLLNLLLLIY